MTSRTEPVIIRDPQPYYIARTGLVNAEVAPFLVGTEILSTDDDGHATWRRVDGVISAPVSAPPPPGTAGTTTCSRSTTATRPSSTT